MKIETIRIQGYRSLADLTFNPESFSVLVGPNNAGKSNVISALDFISDIYKSGVKLAIDRKGGFENISFREGGVSQRTMCFELVVSGSRDDIWGMPPTFPLPEGEDFNWSSSTMRFQFRHRFVLHGQGEPLISNFAIAEEEVEVCLIADEPILLLHANRTGTESTVQLGSTLSPSWLGSSYPRIAREAEDFFTSVMNAGVRSTDLFIDRLQRLSPVVDAFVEHLARIRIYHLLPSACRVPAAPTPAADLGAHGENLPALVYHLKERMESSWQKVMENMSLVLPDLEDIEVQPTTDRLWSLAFLEAGIGNRWTSEEVSDGTIRALALFASLYDPRYALLALEEPENAVHPWILRVFIEACREQSRSPAAKQIVLTTHSPVLIDWLNPSEVAVVWKERSQTHVQPLLRLEPGAQASWEAGMLTLSNLLDSGLLRQAVPSP